MMHYSSFSCSIIYVLLCLLAISVGPWVAAAETKITSGDLLAKINPTAALPGFNVEGGSVFTNFFEAYNNKQLFFIGTGTVVFEKPESDPVRGSLFYWCSDLTFSDVNNNSLIGYAGRCVGMVLAGIDDMLAAGAQLSYDYLGGEFKFTQGISAVFVEQRNVFEGQFHSNTDDWVGRLWDDGRKTMPYMICEGHDEGDMSPNAATSSHSAFGEKTWLSVDEVAQLFNVSVDEFTPETFKQVYLDTWIRDHEEEAATDNPNPLPELEIIEQLKNETNYVDDTTTSAPAQPDSTARRRVVTPTLPILPSMTLGVEGSLSQLLQGLYRQLFVSLVFKERTSSAFMSVSPIIRRWNS